MSNDDIPVKQEIEQTETGVKVTCKSKRGSGTDDRDSVTLVANYDTLGEAHAESKEVVEGVRLHMNKLRQMDNSGRSIR